MTWRPRLAFSWRRFLLFILVLASMQGLVSYIRSLGLVENVTKSMPTGLYRTFPIDRPITKDDIVTFCAPEAAAALAVERGYVPRGDCARGAAQLLKHVAAVDGDVVVVTNSSIVVNGRPLPNSATARFDRRRRPLPAIARGTYRIGPNDIWVWSPAIRGYDSRYYGPVPIANVRAFATLFLPLPD